MLVEREELMVWDLSTVARDLVSLHSIGTFSLSSHRFSVSVASRISCSAKNCCQKLFVFSGSGWVAVIIGFHAKVLLHATCLSFCWFLADIFS